MAEIDLTPQDTPPRPIIGTRWVDTSLCTSPDLAGAVVRRWTGTAWVEVPDDVPPCLPDGWAFHDYNSRVLNVSPDSNDSVPAFTALSDGSVRADFDYDHKGAHYIPFATFERVVAALKHRARVKWGEEWGR